MLAIILSLVLTLIICASCYGSMKPVSNAREAGKYMDREIKLSIKNDAYLRTERIKRGQDKDD